MNAASNPAKPSTPPIARRFTGRWAMVALLVALMALPAASAGAPVASHAPAPQMVRAPAGASAAPSLATLTAQAESRLPAMHLNRALLIPVPASAVVPNARDLQLRAGAPDNPGPLGKASVQAQDRPGLADGAHGQGTDD